MLELFRVLPPAQQKDKVRWSTHQLVNQQDLSRRPPSPIVSVTVSPWIRFWVATHGAAANVTIGFSWKFELGSDETRARQ
jgi:hypothetical protein